MNSIENLSERERQVGDLVMQGMLNKQIALQLGISERTVEFHLNNIFKKLEISSRVELAIHLLKSTGDTDKAEPVESTVVSKTKKTHNDSQSNAKTRWRKALKHTLSLIKKETVKTMKIFSEELTAYVRTRPWLTTSLFVVAAGIAVRLIVIDYGLYFPISYLLLALSIGIGGLFLGMSWRRIREGKFKLRPTILFAIILIPFLILAVDSLLLDTIARNADQVTVTLPGLSNRAVWSITTDGISHLSRERSITNDGLWLFGSFLYILLLTAVGNLAGKWFKKEKSLSA